MAFTRQEKEFIRKSSWILFIMYMAVMAYFLFFSEALNRTNDMVHHYNLVLFQEIKRGFWCLEHGNFEYFFLNIILNVVAFAPFGFILPSSYSKVSKALTLSEQNSSIESVQNIHSSDTEKNMYICTYLQVVNNKATH